MSARSVARRFGRAVRDGWLILGVVVIVVIVLEVAYRGQASVRSAIAGLWAPAAAPEPPSPFEANAWAADYWVGHEKEEAVVWAPYVYVGNPTFEAPFAATDSAGHRLTPHPASDAEHPLRVFFLGGSTTFGWYQRAEHTLPAEAARRLQTTFGDSARVIVTNFGVPGHTFTQEIIELMLELRAGARPHAVVFYDGINDVLATVQNGDAGLPQNEGNRREDFQRGQRLRRESEPGIKSELLAAVRIGSSALERLEFVQRAIQVVRPTRWVPVPIDTLAVRSVRTYVGNVELVEALASRYGFVPIYVWQPALLSTNKPLTPREEWLRQPQLFLDLHQAIPPLIGPAVKAVVGERFIDATEVFDTDSREIFVDTFGHTYERANPVIIDTIFPQLAAAARRALRAR